MTLPGWENVFTFITVLTPIIFFSTFIYTDLIYRVCLLENTKAKYNGNGEEDKKKQREKKSITKGLNLTITKNGSIF